jgi:hypothetical protein
MNHDAGDQPECRFAFVLVAVEKSQAPVWRPAALKRKAIFGLLRGKINSTSQKRL